MPAANPGASLNARLESYSAPARSSRRTVRGSGSADSGTARRRPGPPRPAGRRARRPARRRPPRRRRRRAGPPRRRGPHRRGQGRPVALVHAPRRAVEGVGVSPDQEDRGAHAAPPGALQQVGHVVPTDRVPSAPRPARAARGGGRSRPARGRFAGAGGRCRASRRRSTSGAAGGGARPAGRRCSPPPGGPPVEPRDPPERAGRQRSRPNWSRSGTRSSSHRPRRWNALATRSPGIGPSGRVGGKSRVRSRLRCTASPGKGGRPRRRPGRRGRRGSRAPRRGDPARRPGRPRRRPRPARRRAPRPASPAPSGPGGRTPGATPSMRSRSSGHGAGARCASRGRAPAAGRAGR